MSKQWRRAGWLLLAALAVGCAGEPGQDGVNGVDGKDGAPGLQGAQGEPGTQGENGADGQDAVDQGLIAGLARLDGTTAPAVGLSIRLLPGDLTAVTDAQGQFEVAAPVGLYKVLFGAAEDDGFEPITVENIAVAARFTSTVNVSNVVRSNPLVIDAGAAVRYQQGFGKQVQLSATVTGVPAGVTPTFKWSQVDGPVAALTGANSANVSFTTQRFGDVLASGKTDVRAPVRPGLVAIATQQERQYTYNMKVTVTAGDFVNSATVAVRSAALNAGIGTLPKGVQVIAGTPAQAEYAWTLTAPNGSQATLDYPTEQYVSFVPDLTGIYTLTEGPAAAPRFTKSYSVGEYVGSNTCGMCHPGVKAEWRPTGHARLFEHEINGAGDHYGPQCVSCHTTGSFAQAQNKGFDDRAAQKGWTFPEVHVPGTFEAMDPELQEFAAISCENCHGPGSLHLTNPMAGNIGTGVQSENCNTCHYAMTHHDRAMLHAASPHSDMHLPMLDATWETRGATAAHCGRCHAGQGYVAYADQLKAGKSGNITRPDGSPADEAFIKALGLTQAEVQPVSCATCHDPHTTGLRIEGEIAMLPSGFGVKGVGKGALCMSCHNTRNGARGDGLPMTATSAPHAPSQTEVLLGKNVFFVNTVGQISGHATLEDTCVSCHVEAKSTELEGLPASYTPWHTNHTFRANKTTCSQCHAAGVTGEALQEDFEAALHALEVKIGTRYYNEVLLPELNNAATAGAGAVLVTAWDEATDLYSQPQAVSLGASQLEPNAALANISFFPEIHGQMSLCLTIQAPITITWTNGTQGTTDRICFQMSSMRRPATAPTLPGKQIFTAASNAGSDYTTSQRYLKGLWNLYLLHGDHSKGIHNPRFAYEVIRATGEQF